MRIVNWNIERRGPATWQARSLIKEIIGLRPDLICLTEAWKTSLDDHKGHTISSSGVAWSPQNEDERKVVLWSKTPWSSASPVAELERAGSAVSGVTEIDGVSCRVVGVCIPYHFANPLGQLPKAKMWSEHNEFLRKLSPILQGWASEGPTIVVGDYNRRIPRIWGPKDSYALLEQALDGFELVTAGNIPGVDEQTIDHVAVSIAPGAQSVSGLPAEDEDGRRRSDHFGIVVDIGP